MRNSVELTGTHAQPSGPRAANCPWNFPLASRMLSARMRLAWIVLLGLFAACQSVAPQAAPSASVAATTPSTDRALMLRQLTDAERALAQNPRGEEELIWVGRRLAYLGRIDEAQAVYTRGLELYPESWKLLRHRGHRWITLRQFDRAVEDLSRAWQYSRGLSDEIEPDGQPNAAGIPLSSYHSNIIYHLALAHYLRCEWSAACEVWDQGRESSTQNDDRRCSATYWNALALRRENRAADTSELLAPINRSMVILENESYLQLCLLLKGETTPEAVLLGIESGSTEFATRGYGVACWYRLSGEEAAAQGLLLRIIAEGPANSFGCIAAEADVLRSSRR